VETNGAEVDAGGRLHISPHQPPTAPHGCPLCPPNLCKGAVLSSWLAASRTAPLCVYVGDGGGDYCAASRLMPGDVLLARGAPHDRLLEMCRDPPRGTSVRATIHEWSGADDGASLREGFAAAFASTAPCAQTDR